MKTNQEIYSDVKDFIEQFADKKTLINMLVEAIDNHGHEIADSLYNNYKEDIDSALKHNH